MSELQIVRLHPEQWMRYREIRLEALSQEPQAFGTTYENMLQEPPEFWRDRLMEAARAEKSWLLFAQAGDRLIGIIGAVYDETIATADVISVFVQKAERGKGVGKALMAEILSEIGKIKGIRKAALGVNQEQQAAVRLYRSFGFEVVEEVDEVQGDGLNHPGYRMEKQLD